MNLKQHAQLLRPAWLAGRHAFAAISLFVSSSSPPARTSGKRCKPDHSHSLLYEGRHMACSCPCCALPIQCLATQRSPGLVRVVEEARLERAARVVPNATLTEWRRTMARCQVMAGPANRRAGPPLPTRPLRIHSLFVPLQVGRPLRADQPTASRSPKGELRRYQAWLTVDTVPPCSAYPCSGGKDPKRTCRLFA